MKETTNIQKTDTVKTKMNQTIQKKLDTLESTSMKIRFLHHKNFSRSEIAKILNKRYQHVRNVLITPVKKEIKF